MLNKETMRRMNELKIGQAVTLISRDAGVPDSKQVIFGLSVSPSGREDIILGNEDGKWQTDGYCLGDIRTV